MKPELRLRTEDHPEAKGNKALVGAVEYTLRFSLDDGRELCLLIGEKAFQIHTDMLMDLLSRAPSYSDGSTNEGLTNPTSLE